MAVLFLDPLILGALLLLAVYSWAVTRGWFRSWFGQRAWWTVVAWPLPALVALVPLVAGGLLSLLRLADVRIADGGAGGAALYVTAYVAPLVGLLVWPPRWLLPAWARRRLTPLPAVGPDAPAGAVPAVQGRRGHGSRAAWIWRVDAVPGVLWLDDGQLRFRSVDGAAAAGPLQSGGGFDDEAIAELRFSTDGDLRLEAPRGGWWSRTSLDVDLPAVDRLEVGAVRPWRRDGLLTIEVDGRRPLHLWVGEARGLARQLTSRPPGPEQAAERLDRGGDG